MTIRNSDSADEVWVEDGCKESNMKIRLIIGKDIINRRFDQAIAPI